MSYFFDSEVKAIIDFDYIIDKLDVVTPFGKELKNRVEPFERGEEQLLIDELEKIDYLINKVRESSHVFNSIRGIFAHVKDIRGSLNRATQNITLSEVELFEIKGLVLLLKKLQNNLISIEKGLSSDLKILRIIHLEELFDPQRTELETFYIYDEYSDSLRNIRKEIKKLDKEIKLKKKVLKEAIENELGLPLKQDNTLMASKSDEEIMNKLQNYPYLVYCSETYMHVKYTLKSTPDIDELEEKLEVLREKEEKEEYIVRTYLSKEIVKHSSQILNAVDTIGRLDFSIAKAYLAISIDGIKPVITKAHGIEIIDGRHIRVERGLKKENKSFTPISVNLKKGVTCITGANMGGKTISLKLIGLLCSMTQHGFHVPCTSMKMGLLNFIYASIGDQQSIDIGLSTFGGEIKGLQSAIGRVNEYGLILIDELASGTNPEEGYAISKAIVDYLKNKNSFTIITTHYDNIADQEAVVHLQVVGLANVDYEKLKEEVKNFKDKGIELVKELMDYRLVEVKDRNQVPRDAINIARLMGLDKEIIEKAEKILRTGDRQQGTDRGKS